MLKQTLVDRIGLSPKIILVSLVLISSAFIWYFYAFDYLSTIALESHPHNSTAFFGFNFFSILIAAISGTFLIRKYQKRLKFLCYWMVIGIFLSFIPLIVGNSISYDWLVVISVILGAYFGLGMPICMGYFSAITKYGNRAKYAGITFLFIGLGFFLLSQTGGVDPMLATLVLATSRGLALVILILLKPEEKTVDTKEKVTYRSILTDKSMLLYFVPWLMFLIINNLTFSLNSQIDQEGFFNYLSMAENILAGAFAVIFGFMADSVGRKRLAITGFILLGFGYGILAFIQNGSMLSWIFYTIADGIAWGAFYTIFLFTIWGDLAKEKGSEKFYAIGSLPYLVSNFMRFTIGDYIGNSVTQITLLFSFASFFLFLAILPLIYAPETLPEKHIKDRELKNYLEKAQKIAQKETHKKDKKTQKKKPETSNKQQNDKEYEEARKLAEKYY